jgi:hypothetical protein
VQEKCRAEILNVVGSSRLPDLGNFEFNKIQQFCYDIINCIGVQLKL